MRWNRRSSGVEAEGDSSSVYFMNYYDGFGLHYWRERHKNKVYFEFRELKSSNCKYERWMI